MVESVVPWQEAAAAKRRERQASIPQGWLLSQSVLEGIPLGPESGTDVLALDLPRKCGLLTELDLAITETYSCRDLLQKLAAEELTSTQVTLAFCKRAAIAQQLTNCLTEVFFERGLERAKFLDHYIQTHKKPIGPLHGLPISIKDCFDIKGLPSTIGLVSYLKNAPAAQNSHVIDILLDLGAVLYVKTNVPQSLMTCDSDNNVFGRTLNPYNLSLNAGGSSGGEAALVAFHGSPIGIGTDFGGSVRMPAACTGIYGFKPSSGRVPYGRQTEGVTPGYIPFSGAAGPLCQSLDDVACFMEAIISAKPWNYDFSALAVPWRQLPELDRPLTIGLLAEDPKYPLHPPVRRVLALAAEELSAAGHTVIPVQHDSERSISVSTELMFRYYQSDPDKTVLRIIQEGKEPIVESLLRMNTLGSPDESTELRIRELGAMNRLRYAMIEFWRKTFVDGNLDVLLAPPSQTTAVAHDTWNWIPYTTTFNLVEFPGIVIPFSKSSKELDPDPVTFEAPAIGPSYDPVLNDGAPCSIQILARNLQDEECLRAAKIIDTVLNKTSRWGS